MQRELGGLARQRVDREVPIARPPLGLGSVIVPWLRPKRQLHHARVLVFHRAVKFVVHRQPAHLALADARAIDDVHVRLGALGVLDERGAHGAARHVELERRRRVLRHVGHHPRLDSAAADVAITTVGARRDRLERAERPILQPRAHAVLGRRQPGERRRRVVVEAHLQRPIGRVAQHARARADRRQRRHRLHPIAAVTSRAQA
mmetsp:Transcript_27782/g.81299  ORF Transcript_27782/g.81299 Transcript_27782/m.81299 type:complete len:204 (-) Transcript_27782:1130-1741(-)